MNFAELELHPKVVAGITKNNFVECTPVQAKCIPTILDGLDVAGLAQTGTGKTAAFLLPLMDRVLRSQEVAAGEGESSPKGEDKDKKRPIFKDWKKSNFILVLVPTRELAEQVWENSKNLGGDTELSAAVIYGGTGYEKQKQAIADGAQFVIATPGRLIDLYKEHVIDLNQVRGVVFDEADRMFDMGFKDDMCYILKRIPRDRQFLVFSATLNFDVLNVAYEFGSDPVEIDVSRDTVTADNVEDEIFHVGHHEKPAYLLSLLKRQNPTQAIIFSNFKRNVDRIAKFLTKNDVPAMGISSLLTQAQRNRVMDQFRKQGNNRNILVATDVAARGLDIKGVDLVVNFELPDDPENYVHRIGRTGRAGEAGHAYSLVSDRDVDALGRIENYLSKKLEIGWIEEEHLLKEFAEFPRDEGRSRGGPRSGGDRDRGRGGRDRGRGGRGKDRDRNRRGGKGRDRDRDKDRNRDKRADASSEGGENSRNRDRNRNRNRDRHKEGREGQGENKHRDRRTGRHEAKGGENRNKRKRPNNKRRDQQKGKGGKGRRPGRYRPGESKPAAPASIGQKVSGFFKKLFS